MVFFRDQDISPEQQKELRRRAKQVGFLAWSIGALVAAWVVALAYGG